MTILQAAQADTDNDFLERVSYFLIKAAVAVSAEGESVPQHFARLALAKALLHGASQLAPLFALAIMTNPTLLAAASLSSIPDGDVEFAVNSVFTSMAL